MGIKRKISGTVGRGHYIYCLENAYELPLKTLIVVVELKSCVTFTPKRILENKKKTQVGDGDDKIQLLTF